MHKASPIRQSLWGCACLSTCVSPHSVIINPQLLKKTKYKCVFSCTLDGDVCEHSCASINRCFLTCCSPLADRWKPQARRWGSRYWSPVPHLPIIPSHLVFFTLSPPSFYPLSPLCTHQAERKASVLHSQAPNLAGGGRSLRLFLRETNLALRLTQ